MTKQEYIEKELARHTDEAVACAKEIAGVVDKYSLPISEVYGLLGLLQVIMEAKRADG